MGGEQSVHRPGEENGSFRNSGGAVSAFPYSWLLHDAEFRLHAHASKPSLALTCLVFGREK
jgi:hypothetical protein